MEIEAWIQKKKEIYTAILAFLESESISEKEFQNLTKIIDDQEITKDQKSLFEIFRILYIIGDNHCRTTDFFNRLGRIFEYLTRSEPSLIKSTEIIDIFKTNKRLLLIFFEFKIIIPDDSIIDYLSKIRDSKGQKLIYYLFAEIKNHLDEIQIEIIKDEMMEEFQNKKISKEFNENFESFASKIKIGENDSPICSLIRQDSIQEFISFIERTNLSLESTIEPDFYESNPYLIKNRPSLLEYAFFYGSIQVIKYLQNKHIELTKKLWFYAIHSNNPELIDILDENGIRLSDISYYKCLIESIKCHHNEISIHINYNLLDKSQYQKMYEYINNYAVEYHDYYYYPDDLNSMISNPQIEHFKMSSLTPLFTKITIPSSVNSIGNDVFNGCSSLTQILIPSSVTSIGEYTFCGCTRLIQISIPSSVTIIGEGAFSGCSALEQVLFETPSSLTSINSSTFYGCTRLTQISIPSSVTKIDFSAFKECSSLKKMSIPSSIPFDIKKVDYFLSNVQINKI